MMKTVKHTLYSIGDRGGDLARSFGSGTTDLAKRFGGGTADLAKQIGPKRGLIGLAVLAAAIGGTIVLVRYLRARADEDLETGDAADGTPANGRTARNRKRARAQHRAEANSTH